MPLRREVHFLRSRAQRSREMAEAHRTAFSDQIRVIAHELEALAERVESSDKEQDEKGRA
jgi:hypothetical protein